MDMMFVNKARNNHLLSSWPFLLAIFILLFNDYYLKFAFHNYLTGKLSDFSGIFVIAALLGTNFPARKYSIFFILSTVFIWWKSPYSQSFIEVIQNIGLSTFDRTIDYTDCFALSIIPIALSFADHSHRYSLFTDQLLKFSRIPIILITMFAVTGTSMVPTKETYKIRATEASSKFSREDITTTLQSIFSKLGYECSVCEKNSDYGEYFGNGVDINYKIIDSTTIDFDVTAYSDSPLIFSEGADEKIKEIKELLINEFSRNFDGLEFVEILK